MLQPHRLNFKPIKVDNLQTSCYYRSMKNGISFFALLLVLWACQSSPGESGEAAFAEPVTAEVDTYGNTIVAAKEVVAATEVPTLLVNKDSVYVQLEGTAVSSCTKKKAAGCW